jgi:hypothetical protein
LAIAVAGMAGSAMAQSEIKIGEINSYSLLPAFTEPYRKGWQLAVEEDQRRPAASTARSWSSSPRMTAASRRTRRPRPTNWCRARTWRC